MKIVILLIALLTSPLLYAGTLKPYTGTDPTPPLILQDLHGKVRDLKEFKGQVVLVNFWATWCPPCRVEMPSMWRLKQKFKGRPFVVIAVDMGEEEASVNAFLPDKMKQDFVVMMDKDGAALKQWKVFAFPTSYIIDANGRIRYALYGALEWDEAPVVEKINKLLP